MKLGSSLLPHGKSQSQHQTDHWEYESPMLLPRMQPEKHWPPEREEIQRGETQPSSTRCSLNMKRCLRNTFTVIAITSSIVFPYMYIPIETILICACVILVLFSVVGCALAAICMILDCIDYT